MRFTFRNRRPTPSCGSCQCPPLSTAPQVSVAALAITCMSHVCLASVVRDYVSQESASTRLMEVFLIKCKQNVAFFPLILILICAPFPCWCFHFLPVNRSSREKQVWDLKCILLFNILSLGHLYFVIIALWPVRLCYDFLRVCPTCWGSWLVFSTLLGSG